MSQMLEMSMKTTVAVGVGTKFIIADAADVRGILVKFSGTVVRVNDECYPLWIGTTFAESREIDALMDTGKYIEYDTNAYRVNGEEPASKQQTAMSPTRAATLLENCINLIKYDNPCAKEQLMDIIGFTSEELEQFGCYLD